MIQSLVSAVRNPLGWRNALTITNEIHDQRSGVLVGTYVFLLQQDRFGRRRSRLNVDGPLTHTPGYHIHGRSIAERWVQKGVLPEAA